MRLVKFVLTENAMEYPITIIHVCDAFGEVKNRRNESDMRGEEKCIIGQHSSEATCYEEKKLDCL